MDFIHIQNTVTYSKEDSRNGVSYSWIVVTYCKERGAMFSSDVEINRRVKFIVNPTDEEAGKTLWECESVSLSRVKTLIWSALEAASMDAL